MPFILSIPTAAMEIVVTRRVALVGPLRLIPVHSLIAVDASHPERVVVPRRVSFSPQRTLQSAMRPVFV